MPSLKKILFTTLFLVIFILTALAAWLYSQIDGALPQLQGKVTLMSLNQGASIERDELGIPTIKAKSRQDVAVALGFVHAQERFFQMDLLRKNAAGELASLFGEAALEYDIKQRQHRFRDRAREIVKTLPIEHYTLLKSYAAGVNQGLLYLKGKPFEYLLLNQDPMEWQEEDSMLVVFSMYLDLQYGDGERERTLAMIQSALGDDVYQFLAPKGSIWDAAIDGTKFPSSPMPTRAWPSASSSEGTVTKVPTEHLPRDYLPGSNNWSVGGTISTTGSAIIANDMHLGIRVPNTWFRASIEYPINGKNIKVTGTTLPGAPNIITGSNGNIAWGYTNSYGDWSDIILLETDESGDNYLTPEGYKPFIKVPQKVAIKGKDSVDVTIKETMWGPVIGKNYQGQEMVYRWVAYDQRAVNLELIGLETATNVHEALALAPKVGVPAQNLMVGDKTGNIAWTIFGPIPRKFGEIDELPASWASGERGWDGYLTAEEYPKVINPKDARLWTANSRVVGGEMYQVLGNGGYAIGARSTQIRDDLYALDQLSEQDLLDVALDDRALFLKRWQQFMLDHVLTTNNIATFPQWQTAKTLLENDNNLSASIDSVSYRLVANFRTQLRKQLFSALEEQLQGLDESFSFYSLRHQLETPMWKLINEQPENFLALPADTWQELFSQVFAQVYQEMTDGQQLADATWGQYNTTSIRHPLSKAVPLIGYWLDMPKTSLAGDSYVPRVQGKDFGASERMVVSPGHEETGIFHMPTSQSGHPWSPFYGKGHADWEQGKPSPFLPGKTKYTLTLVSY